MHAEMKRFFIEAVRELRRVAKPLHPKELSRRVESKIDPPYRARDPYEDIREKMAMARQHGSFLVPKPDCLVGLLEWFEVSGDSLNVNLDIFEQPGSATTSYKIALRMERLAGRLLTKVADTPARRAGMARGITVEEYVKQWFRQEFPDFFIDGPDRVLETDFWMLVNDRRWSFDVASVKDDGVVGIPNDKKPTDFHVFGQIKDSSVYVQGYLRGRELPNRNFRIEYSKPIAPIIVWLQCVRDGIDYDKLRHYAIHGQPAKRTNEILRKRYDAKPSTPVEA